MRIAETAGSRNLIIISSLGVAATLATVLATSAAQPEARTRDPIRPMRGCAQYRQRVMSPTPPPPRAARTHSEQVHALRQDLGRCIEGGVEATLVIVTRTDGSVRELKLDGNLGPRPEVFRSCMNAVVKPVMFPPSDTELRVEMLLSKD